jgi:hypothetical protein
LTTYPFTYQQVLAARRCGLLASSIVSQHENQSFLRSAQLLHLLQETLARQGKTLAIKTLAFNEPDPGHLLYCSDKAEAYILHAGKKFPKEASEDWLLKIFFALSNSLKPVLVRFDSDAPYLACTVVPEPWQQQAQIQIPDWLKSTAQELLNPQAVGDQNLCLKPNLCEAYGQCYPDKIRFTYLPQRHYRHLQLWHYQGIDPEKLSSKQRLVWQAENEQRIFWPEQFLKRLKTLATPWATLDFEVIHSAIPLWANCVDSLTVIPFAWAGHYLDNHQLIQSDFIADGEVCPENKFIETLLRTTEKLSTIFVYGSLEKSLIKQLAARHPDASAGLLHLQAKIIDVYQALQNEFYHPWMQGSWSLKRWTDFFSTEKSSIEHGGTAELLYWQSLYAEEAERVWRQRQIANYCAQDSWTLWQLIHWLERRGD